MADRVATSLVSVVIPCYNQARYLADAIRSLLAQAYSHIEIIVVDDGSNDDSAAVAEGFAPRVRLIRQENRGLSEARNSGFAAAHGDLILFLDSDDWLMPGAISALASAAAAHPHAMAFHGSSAWVDEQFRCTERRLAFDLQDAFHVLLRGNPFPVHAVMVRREALAAIGTFDARLKSCEDWDLWLRIAGAGHAFVAVPEAVSVYRRHSNSMSTAYYRMRDTGLEVLRRHESTHPGCWRCRWSLRRSRGTVHYSAFELILFPQIVAMVKRGQIREAFAEFRKAVADNPRIIRYLMFDMWLTRVLWSAGAMKRFLTGEARQTPKIISPPK